MNDTTKPAPRVCACCDERFRPTTWTQGLCPACLAWMADNRPVTK